MSYLYPIDILTLVPKRKSSRAERGQRDGSPKRCNCNKEVLKAIGTMEARLKGEIGSLQAAVNSIETIAKEARDFAKFTSSSKRHKEHIAGYGNKLKVPFDNIDDCREACNDPQKLEMLYEVKCWILKKS